MFVLICDSNHPLKRECQNFVNKYTLVNKDELQALDLSKHFFSFYSLAKMYVAIAFDCCVAFLNSNSHRKS